MKEVCEKLYQKDDLKVMPVVVDSRTNRARYCDCLLKIEVICHQGTDIAVIFLFAIVMSNEEIIHACVKQNVSFICQQLQKGGVIISCGKESDRLYPVVV